MTIQLSVENWVSLPQDTRDKLREVFNVRRSTMASVVGGRLMCDGSTYEDLGVITVEAMQSFLGSKDKNFQDLIAKCIAKVNGEEVKEEVKEMVKEVVEVVGSVEEKPKRGRKKA